jgi:hypothetical protein
MSFSYNSVIAEVSSLEQDLASRHFEKKSSELVSAYGTEDQVVADLIKLRSVQSPPYVSTRAVKLLLGFSSRADVQAVLREDVSNEATLGLCSVILSSLSDIQDEAFRLELASSALSSVSSVRTKEAQTTRSNRINAILGGSTDAKVKALVK